MARRSRPLVETLISKCGANVNGGQQMRPSALDVLQHNRAQQKPFERTKDDEIEQLLLTHKAKNRCSIRRVFNKRKNANESSDSTLPNLACLSIDMPANEQTETARGHARLAAALEEKGDLDGAQESFQQAMTYSSNDTLEWATYAHRSALIHTVRGQHAIALDLLRKALQIRKAVERQSDDIEQIERAIQLMPQSSA